MTISFGWQSSFRVGHHHFSFLLATE
jgi:hypothetical protein